MVVDPLGGVLQRLRVACSQLGVCPTPSHPILLSLLAVPWGCVCCPPIHVAEALYPVGQLRLLIHKNAYLC